jgi:hypothetical protein
MRTLLGERVVNVEIFLIEVQRLDGDLQSVVGLVQLLWGRVDGHLGRVDSVI